MNKTLVSEPIFKVILLAEIRNIYIAANICICINMIFVINTCLEQLKFKLKA